MPAEHDAYAALRYRDYRHLLAGGVLYAVGMEMLTTVVGWELYQRTRSNWVVAFSQLAQFLPVLLFALPAGQAADHFSRHRVVQFAQTVTAVTSTVLAGLSLFLGPVEPGLSPTAWPVLAMLACLLVSGTARAFTAPSRAALLPQVVPLEVLPNAVAWNSSAWHLANAVGPALGGAVLAVAPPRAAYLVAAGCSLGCVLFLFGVRPHQGPRPAGARGLAAVLDGVRFVWRTELLLAAITLDLFAVLLGGAKALLPVFAEDILGVDSVGFGALGAAPAVGALLMGLILAHRPPMARPGRALLWAVAGFGVAMVVFGLSRHLWLSLAALTASGGLDMISVVIRHTLMQVVTPDAMRGRVAAVNTVFISSSNELGGFESGATAALFGPVASVVGGGIGTVLVVLATWRLWPRLARLGPLDELHPEETSLAALAPDTEEQRK